MASVTLKKATLRIKDGAVSPHSLTIKIGDGNLTWSEKRNIEYKLNRGVVDEVREGDDVPMDVRFDAVWSFIKSDTGEAITVEEAIKQVGAASGWTSSDADTCRPYAVNLEFTYDPDCGTTKTEVIVFPDFRWEDVQHDPKTGQISISGKCNATKPTVTRV